MTDLTELIAGSAAASCRFDANQKAPTAITANTAKVRKRDDLDADFGAAAWGLLVTTRPSASFEPKRRKGKEKQKTLLF